MSSRQEEKEARRAEREAAEEQERKAASRKQRIQFVIGGLVAAAAVAFGVIFAVNTGGDDGDAEPSSGSTATASLPEPAILEEKQAAEAAGCELQEHPNEGSTHAERVFTSADYEVNPPTSGSHFPSWAEDGIYESGNTPELGMLVHTLEHGRINVQYRPGTDPKLVDQLEALVAETQGYHMLLYENASDMKVAVAATAWDQSLTCSSTGPELWDALRTFRDAHIDRGPEKVP